jgi:hypothetical protein
MNKFNRHKKMTIRSYIDRFLSRYITDRQTDSITLIIQNCTFNQNSSWINRHRETGNKRIRAREKKKKSISFILFLSQLLLYQCSYNSTESNQSDILYRVQV